MNYILMMPNDGGKATRHHASNAEKKNLNTPTNLEAETKGAVALTAPVRLTLVSRLRTTGCAESVKDEAADEIERLRVILLQIRIDAEAQDVLFEWWGQIDAALPVA
jgi:hypothetical protein